MIWSDIKRAHVRLCLSALPTLAGVRLTLLPLCAAILLTGCVTQGSPQLDFFSRSGQPNAVVANGTFTLAAPRGFCIDQKTLRDDADGIFVLFGHCAAMSGDPSLSKPAAAVLLSAMFSAPTSVPGGSAQMRLIEDFFTSELGRAALARSGYAEDVRIEYARLERGLLVMKIRDASALTDVARSHSYWRGLTVLAGRMSSLSVMPLEEGNVSDAAQKTLLRQFAEVLIEAN